MESNQKINWQFAILGSVVGYLLAALFNYYKGIEADSGINFIYALSSTGFFTIFYTLFLRPMMAILWFLPIFTMVLLSSYFKLREDAKVLNLWEKLLIPSLFQSFKVFLLSIVLYFVLLVLLYGINLNFN